MPRGGRRRGVQGRQYANRSDLTQNARPLPVPERTGLPYGQAQSLRQQQQALPVGSPPPPARPASPPPGGGGTIPLGPFDRATDRPDEPLTAGLPFGPGPGPEALGGVVPNPVSDVLRAAYLRFPSDDLRDILEELESG